MLENAGFLRDRSKMRGDPLADIVTLSGARCDISASLTAAEPWALRYPAPGRVKIIAIVKGACRLGVDGTGAPRRIETGDILLLSGDRAFTMASGPDLAPRDALEVFDDLTARAARIGERDDFVAIGGHVSLDPERGWLLAEALPSLLHLDRDAPEAPTIRFFLDQLVTETASDRPGAGLMSEQLAQLLFVQAMRSSLSSSGSLAPGWPRALADKRLAQALRAMHRAPERPWRLDELAGIAAMSRTGFSVRFKQAAGAAPLTYLSTLRMTIARQRLRETSIPVGALAASLGYASESAFSNAFKRATGLAPSRYRSRNGWSATPAGGERLVRPRRLAAVAGV